jgi:hypothetical protein
MADDTAAAAAPMTIDFLRARLLSERSVSRASKERADQLAARVRATHTHPAAMRARIVASFRVTDSRASCRLRSSRSRSGR